MNEFILSNTGVPFHLPLSIGNLWFDVLNRNRVLERKVGRIDIVANAHCILSNRCGKKMTASNLFKDRISHHHQLNLPWFRIKQLFFLFVFMVPSVLLSVGFYIKTTGRQNVTPEPRLVPSSHTKTGSYKKDNTHSMHGTSSKTPINSNDSENRKPTFQEQTLNRTDLYKRRLPKCLIIGVKKGGTDAIRRFLNTHPNMVCHLTETRFFIDDRYFNNGLESYRNRMPYSYPDQITVEKTTKYFVTENAAKRIQAFNKDIKLILILRHPVKRLISDYHQEKRHHGELELNNRFEELVINEAGDINLNYEPINVSLYYIHLKMWLKYFPLEQIHIVDGDNFIENPVEEIEKIETYLDLPHKITKEKVYFDPKKGFYCYIDGDKHECLRNCKGHTFNPIDPQVYHKLFDFYRG